MSDMFSSPAGGPPMGLWDTGKVSSGEGVTFVGGSMPGDGKAPMDTYSAPANVTPEWFWNNGPMQGGAFGKSPV